MAWCTVAMWMLLAGPPNGCLELETRVANHRQASIRPDQLALMMSIRNHCDFPIGFIAACEAPAPVSMTTTLYRVGVSLPHRRTWLAGRFLLESWHSQPFTCAELGTDVVAPAGGRTSLALELNTVLQGAPIPLPLGPGGYLVQTELNGLAASPTFFVVPLPPPPVPRRGTPDPR